jgi:hypothetical protein
MAFNFKNLAMLWFFEIVENDFDVCYMILWH